MLYRKNLALNVSPVYVGSPRCTAIKIHQESDADIIIASIYMPYDAKNTECEIDFESTLGHLQSDITSNVGCKFIFGGDFNVSKDANTLHTVLLCSFCLSNDTMWLDSVADTMLTTRIMWKRVIISVLLITFSVPHSSLLMRHMLKYYLTEIIHLIIMPYYCRIIKTLLNRQRERI